MVAISSTHAPRRHAGSCPEVTSASNRSTRGNWVFR